jgi:hypothetical protein
VRHDRGQDVHRYSRVVVKLSGEALASPLERTAAQIRQMASDVDPALRASQYARMVVGKQLAILRWAVAEDLFMQ